MNSGYVKCSCEMDNLASIVQRIKIHFEKSKENPPFTRKKERKNQKKTSPVESVVEASASSDSYSHTLNPRKCQNPSRTNRQRHIQWKEHHLPRSYKIQDVYITIGNATIVDNHLVPEKHLSAQTPVQNPSNNNSKL